MNSKKLTIKDSSLSFLLSFLFCQIAIVTLTIIIIFIGRFYNINSDEINVFLNTSCGYLITSTVTYATILLTFLFFNKKADNKITQKIELKKILMYIGVSILSFFALFPIVTCFNTLLIKFGVKINSLPYSLTTKNYFISIISLAIFPAVCEELLFRGLIFKGLKQHGKTFSIIISTLMFTLFHMSLSQAVYPLLVGLLFGVIMYYENNIYYCIVVHFVNNLLSLTISYFNINLVFNHWTFIIMAITLLVVFLSIIFYILVKNKRIEKKQSIETQNKKIFIACLSVMILFWLLVNFI